MSPSVMASPVRWTPINSPDQLPVITSFFPTTGGPLPLNEDDQRLIIFARTKNTDVIVFAAQTEDKAHPIAVSLTRARHAGIEITKHYLVDDDVFDVLAKQVKQGGIQSRTAGISSEIDPLIDSILSRADTLGATDVHSICNDNGATVYVRVHHEILRNQPIRHLTLNDHERLARALFVREEAQASKDWNQDGWLDASISRVINGRDYALRYSQRNNRSGFNWSLRLLPIRDDAPKTFTDLGYTDWQSRALEHALRDPRGIILFVGEMNSGKSTTLATSLVWLRDTFPGRIIQTLEHPIEYRIKGINQASISERSAGDDGMWEAAFRGLLRSDAQIVMVGEIRDTRSACEAQRLATTGHKFLSTIHAPTPIMAMRRLVKEGADPDLLFSDRFVAAIVAQKLLQRLCSSCSMSLSEALATGGIISREIEEGIRAAAPEHSKSLEAVRVRRRDSECSTCGGAGIVGMTVCAALVVPDRKLNALLASGQFDEAETQWLSRAAGVPHGAPFSGLLDHGLFKMFRGEVCPINVSDELGPLTKDVHRLAPMMPRELRLVGDAT